MDNACIIAEIGTSHQGDLGKAIEMVHAAKESGANTAKFQWVYADEIIHPNTGMVRLPGGNIPLYERFKSLEQGPDFFAALKESCKEVGIEFLCTPFGLKSAGQLLSLGVTRFKIASPELNHLPLIEYLAATGLPLLISSGVSKLSDIEEALDTIREARLGRLPNLAAYDARVYRDLMRSLPAHPEVKDKSGFAIRPKTEVDAAADVTLLHCMTAYPSPEEEYNLLLIRSLRDIFRIPTGISDHSLDPVLVPVVSRILGAKTIEKHFTLSNEGDGLDDPIALSPEAFAKMCKAVRTVEANMGSSAYEKNQQHKPREKTPQHPKEQAARTRYPFLTIETSAEIFVLEQLESAGIDVDPLKIVRILGNGRKVLAPSERDHYGKSNRSLHVLRHLDEGTILRAEDICIVRSEKILRPGLHPRYLPHIIGKKTSRAINSGEGVQWNDLLK